MQSLGLQAIDSSDRTIGPEDFQDQVTSAVLPG